MTAIFSNQDSAGNQIITPLGIDGFSGGADTGNRLRASTINTLVSWRQTDGSQGTDKVGFTTASGGTATFSSTAAHTTLAVTTNANSRAYAESTYKADYDAGIPLLFFGTATVGSGQLHTHRRIGVFDDNNGAFFQLKSTTPQVVIRSNVSGSTVNTEVDQTNWNIDKMDGSGPSQVTIDFGKIQTYVIDVNWLAGIVRFGFVLQNGSIVYCHHYTNPNTGTLNVYATSKLPFRFEIQNDGTSPLAAASMNVMGGQLALESGMAAPVDWTNGEPFGVDFQSTETGAPTAAQLDGVNRTYRSLFIIKPKVGVLTAQLLVNCMSAGFMLDEITPSSAGLSFGLVLNPTLSGSGTFSAVHTDSKFQYDKTPAGFTMTYGTGRKLTSWSAGEVNSWPLGHWPSTTPVKVTLTSTDILVMYGVVNKYVNGNPNWYLFPQMSWLEPA